MSKTLRIIGSIDADKYSVFVEELAAIEKPKSKILIELTSDGGDTYVALAFYGRIIQSPSEITVVGYGPVMSAATIILAAGHRRYMDENAWFMVHEETIDSEVTNLRSSTSEILHAGEIERRWADILAKHSHMDSQQWLEMSAKTTYLDAKACVVAGIAHGIWRGGK